MKIILGALFLVKIIKQRNCYRLVNIIHLYINSVNFAYYNLKKKENKILHLTKKKEIHIKSTAIDKIN